MAKQIKFLKLYEIDDAFIKDLHDNVNKHVFDNEGLNYQHSRKYLGLLLEINSFSYYAPLSSPKPNDYININGQTVIRHSILPIIRMVERDSEGKHYLLGTIKLSNMIPVPSDKLIDYDLDNEQDVEYKKLVLKEKRFINRNEEMIISYAESLYRQKSNGTCRKGYLDNTFDFHAFEEYVLNHYAE